MRISDWSSDVCSSDLLLPLRADALAVGFERGKLVLEDHLAVVKQASDQRRLAVIDRAAGDEAQQRLLLMLREISVDILGNEGVGDVDGVGHQNYPSCFFFSILDRKSVVSGKSVSVRVDLGGRRIIKKKKK